MVYVHVPSLVCVLALTWTWHYSYRNNVLQWFKVGTLKNILTFYRASTYRDAESWSFFYNCIWMVSKCSNIWMVSKCSNVINRPLLKKICFIVERRALCKFIELKKKIYLITLIVVLISNTSEFLGLYSIYRAHTPWKCKEIRYI